MLGLWLSVSCAECQTAAPRTGPAVFGGTATRADAPGGLDFSAQLFAAYDDDVLTTQGRDSPNQPKVGGPEGFYSGLGIALLYARSGDRASFRSWASSALNYYPVLKDLTTTYHEVGLALSAPLGKRFNIHVSPFVKYSPLYSMQLFLVPLPLDSAAGAPVADGAGPTVPDLDFTVVERKSFRYGSSAGLSLLATDRSSVSFSYGYMRTTTESDDRSADFRSADFEVQSGGISFVHRLNRSATLRTGYTLREGTYERSVEPVTRAHTVDVGLDYQKPLSRSRRTFVHFSTGSAIVEEERGERIQVIGAASLVHQMGRTWTAQTQYSRQIRYVEGFPRPVFSDSASSTVSGLLTRRVDLAVTASYFAGTVGVSRGSQRFDSYSASARLRRALTRTLAAYVEYRFYHYVFDEATVRPANLPRQFNRNGARVGLNLWFPLTD